MPPAEKLKLPDPPPTPTAAPPAPAAPKVVRMFNPEAGDKEADVHPAEVDNWKATGWRVKG